MFASSYMFKPESVIKGRRCLRNINKEQCFTFDLTLFALFVFLTYLHFMSRTQKSHFLSSFSPQRGLGPYSFIIFAVICLVTLIYIWLVVPETKKKTFLEVFQMFAKRNKVELNLGDGDLPLKELKESPQDAQKATPF